MKGRICSLPQNKKFGFIQDLDGNQHFFHMSMLSDGVEWDGLAVGLPVDFKPAEGKKGSEAHDVVLRPASEIKGQYVSVDEVPGRYGNVIVERGFYTNPDRNMYDVEGLAFQGAKGDGRFPVDDQMITALKEMRAIFDRDNKIWFLPLNKAHRNLDKLRGLTARAKWIVRSRQIKMIALWVGTLALIVVFAEEIMEFLSALFTGLAVIAFFAGGAFGGRTKISCTGHVWSHGIRLT